MTSKPTRAESPHRDGVRVEGISSRAAGQQGSKGRLIAGSRIVYRISQKRSHVRVFCRRSAAAGSRQGLRCALTGHKRQMFSGQPGGPRWVTLGDRRHLSKPVGQKMHKILDHSENQTPLVQPNDVRLVPPTVRRGPRQATHSRALFLLLSLLMKRCALRPLSHLGVAQQPPTKVHSACSNTGRLQP